VKTLKSFKSLHAKKLVDCKSSHTTDAVTAARSDHQNSSARVGSNNVRSTLISSHPNDGRKVSSTTTAADVKGHETRRSLHTSGEGNSHIGSYSLADRSKQQMDTVASLTNHFILRIILLCASLAASISVASEFYTLGPIESTISTYVLIQGLATSVSFITMHIMKKITAPISTIAPQ
jgi:hypothetical protein